MGGLSSDPAKRANQLANLKRGGTIAPLGNQRSRKHGAYATIAIERLDAKTREVLDALAADLPLRDGDGGVPASDVPLLRLLADVLCRLDDIGAWLSAHGWQDAKDEPRQVVDVESRLRREAAQYLDALGCSPAARVRLGLDIARSQQVLVISDLVRDAAAHMRRKEQDAAVEAQAREIRAQRVLDEGKRDRDA